MSTLIKIEGKPVEKLIAAVSNAIGTLYRPIAIRKEASAKAYEIEIIEKAKSKAAAEGKIVEAETYDRIHERMLNREINRQHNIDNVVNVAIEQLSQETDVSDDQVNPDWLNRLFNIVEDISDQEMLNLWGRILSGEVKQPKSFSLRTLELLKNMSAYEAEVFLKFARAGLTTEVSNSQGAVVYDPDNGKLLEAEFGINFYEKLLMVDIGLMNPQKDVGLFFDAVTKGTSLDYFVNGKKAICIERSSGTQAHHIQVIAFSKAGAELFKLIDFESSENYIRRLCLEFKIGNTRVYYGNISHIIDGKIELIDKQEI